MFEDDDNAKKAIDAASDAIESAQENIRIELQFTKAARVGLMLKAWRKMMLEGNEDGSAFSEDWVEHAAMDIFHNFFSPIIEGNPYYEDEHDD